MRSQQLASTTDANEDFVVVQQHDDLNLIESQLPNEDFVVVGPSPALSSVEESYTTSADEDFVVVGDEQDASLNEQPEVDLTDYINQ